MKMASHSPKSATNKSTGSYCLRHLKIDSCIDVWDVRDFESKSELDYSSHVPCGNTYISAQLVFGLGEYEADFTIRTLSQLRISTYNPPPPVNKYSLNLPPVEYPSPKSLITFPDLPTEIRLQIWRAAFSGSRHVSMNLGCTVWHQNGDICTTNLPLKLPATLFVNRESRYEMLRHYYMIYPFKCMPENSQQVCMRRPFYFNPTVDSAYFEMGERLIDFDCCHWLNYLKANAPKLLDSIRSLEVRDIGFRSWGEASWSRAFLDGYYDFEDTILPFFSNLETLCFTSRAPNSEGQSIARIRSAWELDGLKTFQQDANTWYKRCKAKESQTEDVGDISNSLVQHKADTTIVGKIRTPKIICRSWAKLSNGPFDPYADEEEL